MRRGSLAVLALSLVYAALGSPAPAQVNLTVQKSGGDVNLSWSGGTGPYNVHRSTSPKMTSSNVPLASNQASTTKTDTGAAADRITLYTYMVSDAANLPALNIAMPCDTPAGGPLCNFATTLSKIDISGTTNGNPLYVNELSTPVVAGSFTATKIPLNLGLNTITAVARGVNDNWAVDQITITRSNGNLPPTIDIAVSDRGATAIAADGATIYDPTPQIIVNYGDSDGTLNPTAKLKIYINGTDRTGSFTKTATQATYQIPPAEIWSAGSNFVYASIMDGPTAAVNGFSASASAHIILSNPAIASFSPGAEGGVGAAITINGAGFDPTPANNTVTFSGAPSFMPTAATATTLSVTVPTGAQTGNVTVSVDGRVSAGKSFRVLLASGYQAISSLRINPGVSNRIFFTDRGSNDQLYEILGTGSVVSRCSLGEATGLAVDGLGRLYFGNNTSPDGLGPVHRYDPAGPACSFYQNTMVPGEATASVSGTALTDIAGAVTLYSADRDNGRIKRVDPGPMSPTNITPSPTTLANPCGMAVSSTNALMYFSGINDIRSIPIPGGGLSTVIRGLASGPKGVVMSGVAPTEKLIVARTGGGGAVSLIDPTAPCPAPGVPSDPNCTISRPYWDFANVPSAQAVALGSDAGGQFIVVAEPTRIYRIAKPSVILTDAADVPLPAKLVVDLPTGTPTCLVNNVLTLKVKFSPTTLVPDTVPMKQRVTWTVEDPDDPSGDATIDTNGSTGGDNIRMLGSYNQWESDGTYSIFEPGLPTPGNPTANSIDTEVIGGISRIKFHPSCHPGDNYRIKATVTVPVYGMLEGSTEVVTIWRKLHLERDSMGVAIGPFDCDPDGTAIECDAVMEDIPDPVVTYLTAAFKPAYIDVVLPPDTGEDTSNVRFQYNVPGGSIDIAGQASAGHSPNAASSEGRWIAYVQGAYEGDIAADNDPNGEPGSPGGVTVLGQASSLIFNETIRDAAAAAPRDNEYDRSVVPPHEVGHQFNISGQVPANSCGLMTESLPILSPLFCPQGIRIIRENTRPSFP